MGIALNIDLGELPDEPEELYRLAHWANIACGGHAGDEASMRRAIELCARFGTEAGAHPSFVDRENFGRRATDVSARVAQEEVVGQLQALRSIAAEAGVTLRHVKAHGALYHAANADLAFAGALVSATRLALGGEVTLVGEANGALAAAAKRVSMPFARERFPDRGVDSEGKLLPRGTPGALVTEPREAALRTEQVLRDTDCETLCVHGDTPGAVEIARAVRATLDGAR